MRYRLLLFAALLAATSPARAQKPGMVVVISLDAFGAETLHSPDVPAPTLRALMSSGAYARSMRPINPTVTWRNHTAIMTGVDASRHFVMANGLITNQRKQDAKPSVAFPSTKAALVHVPTLYDAAHAAGLTTAEIDWVAIHEAHTIDFAFEENPDPNSVVVKEMLAASSLKQTDLNSFRHGFQPRRDQMYTAAAVDIIQRHHPNLLLLHYLALDSAEHAYGFDTQAGADAIAFLDSQVKQVVDAVRAAGDLDRTTFFIVSDHGQMTVTRSVNPQAMLLEAGIKASEATVLPEGGVAYIYVHDADAAKTASIKKAFEGKEGVASVLLPESYQSVGIADPKTNPQAPDLLVFATPGFSMSDGSQGPAVELLPAPRGAHGFLNTDPLMQQIFIASGKGVRNAGEIEPISVLDVAPTIARILGVKLDNIQGRALEQILR